jgi:hypothetical protein
MDCGTGNGSTDCGCAHFKRNKDGCNTLGAAGFVLEFLPGAQVGGLWFGLESIFFMGLGYANGYFQKLACEEEGHNFGGCDCGEVPSPLRKWHI